MKTWRIAVAPLVLVWLSLTGPGTAQENGDRGQGKNGGSHNLDLFKMPGGFAGEEMLERLGKKRLAEFSNNPKQFLENFEKLKEQHPELAAALTRIDLQNPEQVKSLKSLLESAAKDFGSNPGNVEDKKQQFLNHLNKIAESNSGDKSGQTGTPPGTPPGPESQAGAGGQPTNPPGENVPPNPAADPANPSTTTGRDDSRSPSAERFEEFMTRMYPGWQNSPGLRNAVRKLAQNVNLEDDRWKKLDANLGSVQERLTDVGRKLHLDRLAPEKGINFSGGWVPKAFDDVMSRGRLSSPTLPTTDMSGDSPAVYGLVIIVALILASVAAWKMAGSPGSIRDGDNPASWHPGPWPVRPNALASAAELIRAFEYLSLLTLGPAARHWNHRAIADQLSTPWDTRPSTPSNNGVHSMNAADPMERRHAAVELADLYESARYWPPEQPLPVDALSRAGRHLCLLAGVNPA